MPKKQYDHDLIVIGAGSGGVRASRMSAQKGARVAVIEESRIGGTCVMRGCVPKKLLVMGAHFAEDFEDAKGFGWTPGQATFDWGALIAAKNRELDRLEGIYRRILRDSGANLIEGRAKLVDPHTVEVGGKAMTAKHLLIAVGGWPSRPGIPGIDHAITSNEALDLPSLPGRVVILGGGYIAVEFAGIFAALGAKVTIVIRAGNVLRGFDEDVREALVHEMEKKGVVIKREAKLRSIEKTAAGYSVLLDGAETIEADVVMNAMGRTPNTGNLGLAEIGVALDDKGAVKVDRYSRTSVRNIYAVGDATDRVNLTPVAIAEGAAVAETLFGRRRVAVDHANIPSAVFSQPPIGTVGLTEAQAREKGPVRIFVSRFRPMKHTLSGRDEKTLMKLVVDAKTDRVLGVHMVGADAPEIVQGLGIAIKCKATKAQFDATVGIHPTAAEEFVTMREPLPDHGEAAKKSA